MVIDLMLDDVLAHDLRFHPFELGSLSLLAEH